MIVIVEILAKILHAYMLRPEMVYVGEKCQTIEFSP